MKKITKVTTAEVVEPKVKAPEVITPELVVPEVTQPEVKVPEVDMSTPLPTLEQPKVDEVMVVARREWYIGIGLFTIFIGLVGVTLWGYNKSNIQIQTKTEGNQVIVEQTPAPVVSPVPEVKPMIVVWNGSGVAGAAGTLADKFKAQGYEVIETKNAPSSQVGTTIEISPDLLTQKDKISDLVGESKIIPFVENGQSYNVKIVIGK